MPWKIFCIQEEIDSVEKIKELSDERLKLINLKYVGEDISAEKFDKIKEDCKNLMTTKGTKNTAARCREIIDSINSNEKKFNFVLLMKISGWMDTGERKKSGSDGLKEVARELFGYELERLTEIKEEVRKKRRSHQSLRKDFGDIFKPWLIKVFQGSGGAGMGKVEGLSKTEKTMMEKMLELLKEKKQIILQGAPGVGKTYTTKELALRAIGLIKEGTQPERPEIIIRYKEAVEKKRIYFSTFHQSMDYEDFIEGYKPIEDSPSFKLTTGPFKEICTTAAKDKDNYYVMIIDEINRGNVSKIFGELITLLETDKREGMEEELVAKLTYSKEDFSVPKNLYIIGTMNTADRSLGQIDYALRRRFAFYTIKADENALKNFYQGKAGEPGKTAIEAFTGIKKYLDQEEPNIVNEDLDSDDIMIGHSYFMAETEEEFDRKKKYEILPLLEEYRKDGIIADSKKIFDKKMIELGLMNAKES